jgi:uncharacterized caspase-like protein
MMDCFHSIKRQSKNVEIKRFGFLCLIVSILLVFFIPFLLHADTRGITVIVTKFKGQVQEVKLYDYTAALIIGIDRYENLGSSEQLSYAVRDAKGVAEVLRDDFQFNEILTLHNEEATRNNIMRALYGFRSLTSEGGIFIYFAGHGITIPGTLDGKDLGYLVPYDGSLDSSEMYKNISMQQIKSDICGVILAKHIFFVFDACFAGLMLDTRSTLAKSSRDFSYLKAITNEKVRQVLTAGAKGETVLDNGPGGHSVFTGRFIEALKNTEDYITARELGQYLRKRVYGDAAARGHSQRPIDGKIYGTGDFVFVADLEKRDRKSSSEIDTLKSEISRLKNLEKALASAKEESSRREIEIKKSIKEAELKQAQIRRNNKQKALKRQQQLNLEAKQIESERKKRDSENEHRLAMLRTQAKKMRQELKPDLIKGGTLEFTVSEMRKIKKQRDKINFDISTELAKQVQSTSRFYEKKIARIMGIPPWDKEFESEKEYQDRLNMAKLSTALLRDAKIEKLASQRQKMETLRDSLLKPLDKQINSLKEKRFPVLPEQTSFKFLKYSLKPKLMIGAITLYNQTKQFFVIMPVLKAREYKFNPELLVPEVHMKATLDGPKFDQVVFHGPAKNEIYKSKPFLNITDDGRFVTFAVDMIVNINKGLRVVKTDGIYAAYVNRIVEDTKSGLEWVAGPDRDTKFNEARSWVKSLAIEGDDWRMPTTDELKTLFKRGKGSLNMTPLLKISGYRVWSGEGDDLLRARDFAFTEGFVSWAGPTNSKNARALAVRTQSVVSDEIRIKTVGVKNIPLSDKYKVTERNGVYVTYSGGVVRDPWTGLDWKAGPDRDTDWYEAKFWIEGLNISNWGWRMPTTDELKSLYNNGTGSRNMTPLLKTTGWWVWSGETKKPSDARGYNFFRHGGRFWDICSASSGSRAFAVRDRNN